MLIKKDLRIFRSSLIDIVFKSFLILSNFLMWDEKKINLIAQKWVIPHEASKVILDL